MKNIFHTISIKIHYPLLIAWFVFFVGLIVMIGWSTHSKILVQVLPNGVPMQFNTALGFVLISGGLISVERYPKIANSLIFTLLLLSSLTLVQYFFSINFYIDELFMSHFTTVKSFYPGRMSPSTAFSFLLMAVTFYYQSSEQQYQVVLSLIMAGLVLLLACISLFGYLIQLPKAYNFGQFTGMAIHTAIGFLLISFVFFQQCWATYHKLNRDTTLGLPISIFIAGILIFFLIQYDISQRLYRSAELELQKRADSFSSQIILELNNTLRLFQRFYYRYPNTSQVVSQSWKRDAISYLNDIPSLRAIIWISQNSTIPNIVFKQPTLTSDSIKQLTSLCESQHLSQATFKLSFRTTEWQNRHYLCISNTEHSILSIIELNQFINQLFLSRIKTENVIQIISNKKTIYQNKALPTHYTPPFRVSSPLSSHAFSGTLQLLPLPQFIENYNSSVPLFVFLIGFITTSLLSLAVRFWDLAKARLTLLTKSNAEVSYLAYHDPLTGLLNRARYESTIESYIKHADNQNHHIALLLLDLDRFKYLNDTLGHDAGDSLLIMVASLLREAIYEHDSLFRIGGDEFCIILEGLEKPEHAANVAKKILDLFRDSFPDNVKQLGVTASIGISTYPVSATDRTSLTKNADIALYHAKRNGKNTFQFFSAELDIQSKKRFEIESLIFYGFRNNEFYELYQPIISLQTKKVVGIELLLRWNSSTLQQVLPDDFIPVAEESHLILEIARWSFKKAIATFSNIYQSHPDITLSINLSPQQVINDNWCEYALKILHSYSVPPNAIKFELTESDIIDDLANTRGKLNELVTAGFQIDIDDFGTGYNSLQLLREFPIHGIKIDKQFVDDLSHADTEGKMIKSIIAIANMYNMTVTAEGVETETQFHFLLNNHCQLAQGFYFARPLTKDELLNYLSR